MSFFPRHCGHQSLHCGLNFRTDCALFYFKYMTYSYSDNSVYTKKHCGNLTTAFVVVFLATFLMQCMDVESNPGPDTRNNRDRGGDYLRAGTETRDVRRRSGTNTDRTPHDTASYTLGDIILKMESFQAQMVELMSRRLQQVDKNQTVLSDNIHTLNERFRSLQSQNDQLREDVVYLSAKCEALERRCGQLYDGQSDVFRTTRDLDDQLDKLEAHSRRNNVRFFSVIEDPNEDYKAYVHSGQTTEQFLSLQNLDQ